jgi:hypothetical protein
MSLLSQLVVVGVILLFFICSSVITSSTGRGWVDEVVITIFFN